MAIKKREATTTPGRAYPPLTDADKTFLANAKHDVTVLIAAVEERDSAIAQAVETNYLLMKHRDEQVDIIAAMREYLQHIPCQDCGGKGTALVAFDRKHGGK